eukprot:gb/GEZJ01003305.1/.p1 GENE.gb/GEZJ01003305.1/~~gb/GEZJ01003305.1/.p1  ORF type:complete len:223 (-),score=16.93 gb/GEZJ01003305.1/:106-774(-)
MLVAFDSSNNAADVTNAKTSPALMDTLCDMAARSLTMTPLQRLKIHAIVNSSSWLTSFSHVCQRQDHIDAVEGFAKVLGLKGVISHSISKQRIALLSYRTAIIGAFLEYSFASNVVLPTCRIATLTLAHDVLPSLLYCTSKLNPTDAPFRSQPSQLAYRASSATAFAFAELSVSTESNPVFFVFEMVCINLPRFKNLLIQPVNLNSKPWNAKDVIFFMIFHS